LRSIVGGQRGIPIKGGQNQRKTENVKGVRWWSEHPLSPETQEKGKWLLSLWENYTDERGQTMGEVKKKTATEKGQRRACEGLQIMGGTLG